MRLAILAVAVAFGLIAGNGLSIAVAQGRGTGSPTASADASTLDEATLEERETVEHATKRAERLGPTRRGARASDRHLLGLRSAKL